MEYIKEDGSLDAEHIRRLHFEEKWKANHSLTESQMNDYIDYAFKRPINESKKKTLPIKVDFSMEDLLAKGYGTIEDIYNIITK